jgi:hypothetical protein
MRDIELHKVITDKKLRSHLKTHFELDIIAMPTPLADMLESTMAHRVELE